MGSAYIVRLQNGRQFNFAREALDDGQDRVRPTMHRRAGGCRNLGVGDIVLCKVNGKQYLHLVKAIQGKRYQIGTIEAGSTDGSARTASSGNA